LEVEKRKSEKSGSRKPGQAKTANKKMKNCLLGLSVLLNLLLLGGLIFLNDRYGLWAKVQRVALEEARVPGIAASYEMNRNYQARREMFRLDKNESAKVLMLGDSLTAQWEWNAMLGSPMVANRGIDGDTSAGVLARIGDDADFRGDAVVIWIGTNDVLQGEAAGAVVERIIKVARRKAKLTTEGTIELRGRCEKEQPKVAPKDEGVGTSASKSTEEKALLTTDNADGHGYLAGVRPGSRACSAFSNPSTSELARDSENSSLTHFASGPASDLDAGRSTLDLVLEAPNVFVLGIPPIARWWEGARERNGTIREINAALAAKATAEGYAFVDLHPVLADENRFLRGEMTSDGVHLSAKGYEAVLEKLKESGLF
jgi:lysophospholipase L1-like esterase